MVSLRLSFIVYILLIPFQIWGYKKFDKYSISFEILFVFLFNILLLIGCYIYYKSKIIEGEFSFLSFTFEVYYPIFFILLPIIIFARWFANKKIANPLSEKIIITGDNKLDVLQIKEQDLICVSSADNYVVVSYLTNDLVSKNY